MLFGFGFLRVGGYISLRGARVVLILKGLPFNFPGQSSINRPACLLTKSFLKRIQQKKNALSWKSWIKSYHLGDICYRLIV